MTTLFLEVLKQLTGYSTAIGKGIFKAEFFYHLVIKTLKFYK